VKTARIVFSEAAAFDILEQADWYEVQSGLKLARRWESAVSNTLYRISRSPFTGALCGFKAETLRTVRRALIRGFPKHLVFYQYQEKELMVLRVVHGARDLESLF
jgi:toxin ParE1/3/4